MFQTSDQAMSRYNGAELMVGEFVGGDLMRGDPGRGRHLRGQPMPSDHLRAGHPRSEPRADYLRTDQMTGARKRVRRGEYLLHCGMPFHAIYAIHAGSFKTLLLTEGGHEQVTGFHMTGELLGLENIGFEYCTGEAVALEDSEVVEIPFSELDGSSHCDPALQRELFRLLAGEIQRTRSQILLLGSMCAEERLATHLLSLSARLAARGWSPTHFVLRMTREEIGSLLGLKLETVSRILSRFQAEGLISVRNREIEILEMGRLQSVIGRREVRREAVECVERVAGVQGVRTSAKGVRTSAKDVRTSTKDVRTSAQGIRTSAQALPAVPSSARRSIRASSLIR